MAERIANIRQHLFHIHVFINDHHHHLVAGIGVDFSHDWILHAKGNKFNHDPRRQKNEKISPTTVQKNTTALSCVFKSSGKRLIRSDTEISSTLSPLAALHTVWNKQLES